MVSMPPTAWIEYTATKNIVDAIAIWVLLIGLLVYLRVLVLREIQELFICYFH
tara:strand:+ start:102 stop:260 length:159 start_codon:yes stop_codon:yes gene_type:complete